ncbi:MAG: restriction endonuclease subunit S [Clostridiales bacterium]|nr:restriction endonuclease subunit S [Clostridiales bacterium]
MGKYKISDICKLEKGKQIDTSLLSENNKYKYINGGVSESGYYADYNTSGKVITVSEGGASCGFVNYIEEPFWCGCHCYRLTDIKFPPKYIYYALKANQENIMALRTGSAMPNIKKSSFERLEINLSEKSEERDRITSVLERIDYLIYNRQIQCELYAQLVKSRFIGELIDKSKSYTKIWGWQREN